FERKGLFLAPVKNVEEDRLIDVALSAGADDVRRSGETFEVLCDPAQFEAVKQALVDARVATESAEISRIPANTVELDADQARQVLALIAALEEHEDIQSVTANYSIPDELLAEFSAALG
ncbi:MAG: YebC/PmpR family DNA-binding transcriptional regulator, partial [Planctomycetaceae bacterium]